MPLPRYPMSVRPMVRYVDQEQAVIEVQVSVPTTWPDPPAVPKRRVDLFIEMHGSDGFVDEQRMPVRLREQRGFVRFEMVQPQRWWPAGMGEQMLYELSVTLLDGEVMLDRHCTMLGLRSVRGGEAGSGDASLIVNGELCDIRSVVAVDLTDECKMLPVAGDSLLVVRDHYGTDVLYDAADRAGILMVQCVPIHPQGTPEHDVAGQIARLAGHPSLAGWYVGHLGAMIDEVAAYIRGLDPTHSIFRNMPGQVA